MEEREQQLYRMLRSHNRPSTLSGPSDILYPSEICSCVLFKYAAEWIWLHFAVDATSIEKQRVAFFERCDCVDPIDAMDASWLGLYFSYLTVRSILGGVLFLIRPFDSSYLQTALFFTSDDEILKSSLPNSSSPHSCVLGIFSIEANLESLDDIAMVMHNWYDAALFFLHRSDFLSVLDVRNVQTIAILGVVFINLGDFNLYWNLWGCAVRIAQALDINTDAAHMESEQNEPQTRCHLWWTLVISDWLSFQLGYACIREDEFMVELPCTGFVDENSDELESLNEKPKVSQYHLVMSKIASALYRFKYANSNIPEDWETTMQVVQTADNDLADIIAHLPSHLQPTGAEVLELTVFGQHAHQSWISNQRRSLSIILLYYRMVINRTQKKHEQCPPFVQKRATLICLDSAHAVVRACIDPELPNYPIPVWYALISWFP